MQGCEVLVLKVQGSSDFAPSFLEFGFGAQGLMKGNNPKPLKGPCFASFKAYPSDPSIPITPTLNLESVNIMGL